MCGCFGSGAKTEVILIIKGPFIFVFTSETASGPKYAISLLNLKTDNQGNGRIALTDTLGDVQYELTFDTNETATEFARVVNARAANAETDEIRKQLGHGHLVNKRASCKFAEDIAMMKMAEQPEKPGYATGENFDAVAGVAGAGAPF
jgi:hypothetical protein